VSDKSSHLHIPCIWPYVALLCCPLIIVIYAQYLWGRTPICLPNFKQSGGLMLLLSLGICLCSVAKLKWILWLASSSICIDRPSGIRPKRSNVPVYIKVFTCFSYALSHTYSFKLCSCYHSGVCFRNVLARLEVWEKRFVCVCVCVWL